MNAPALFGPMMCAAYLALARGVRSGCEVCVGHVRAARARATGSGATPSNGDSSSARMDRKDSSFARKDWKDSSFARKDWKDSSFARKDRRDRAARKDRAMLAWMVWFPLVALSTAPHQEPRFLLPLLLPLAATRYAAASGTRARCAAWCALNLAGVVFFGVAHQGGVAPALLALPTLAASNAGAAGSNPVVAFFWRTYTPPESVLARRDPLEDHHVRVVDLAGAPPEEVLEALVSRKIAVGGNATETVRRDATRLLVTPATAASAAADEWRSAGAKLETVWSWAGHFSGEETDAYVEAFKKGGWNGAWNAMRLGVYRVETKGRRRRVA